jgi:hypothetical protein
MPIFAASHPELRRGERRQGASTRVWPIGTLGWLEGRYYADLPDSFACALELFVAGYGVLPSGGNALVLGYPVD